MKTVPQFDESIGREADVSGGGRSISELQVRVRQLERDLMEREGLIAVTEAELAQRRKQVEDLFRELEWRANAIQTILNSRCWRLTFPLRLAGNAARQAKRFLAEILNFRWRNAFRTLRSGPGGSAGIIAPHEPDSAEVPEIPLEKTLGHLRGIKYVHRVSDSVDSARLSVKAIAIYHPQSPCGGAADWRAVAEASPRYVGHYQPQFPGDLGFYDVRDPGVLRQQIELAKQYGIWGFCFRQRAMGQSQEMGEAVDQILEDPGLDIRFCFCWLEDEDRTAGMSAPNATMRDPAIIQSVFRAFSDSRYIRIDERPLLIVDRVIFGDDASATMRLWRDHARQLGLPGLYIVAARLGDPLDPAQLEFDAAIELPPLDVDLEDRTSEHSLLSPDFNGRILDYRDMAERRGHRRELHPAHFETVMTGWDSEPRRPRSGLSFAGSTPALYAKWLRGSCDRALLRRAEERMVFINAWNAWADGAHLEPDRRFGYAYLHATANVLRYYHSDPETQELICQINAQFVRSSESAVILHCHYEDLIAPMFDRYISKLKGADLIVTVRTDVSKTAVEEMRRRFPNLRLLCHENRGRDVRPFLLALGEVRSLGYEIACKIHTKKTPNWDHGPGSLWRRRLLDPLLGSPGSVQSAAELFREKPDLGLLAPPGSLMDLSLPHLHIRNTFWLDRLLQRMGRTDLAGAYRMDFPAGSMYWFRVSALAGFDDLVLEDDSFEPELGQVDGTLAHAAERLVAVYAQGRGYRAEEIPVAEVRIRTSPSGFSAVDSHPPEHPKSHARNANDTSGGDKQADDRNWLP